MKTINFTIIVCIIILALTTSSYPINENLKKRTPYKVVDGIAGAYGVAPTLDVGEEMALHDMEDYGVAPLLKREVQDDLDDPSLQKRSGPQRH